VRRQFASHRAARQVVSLGGAVGAGSGRVRRRDVRLVARLRMFFVEAPMSLGVSSKVFGCTKDVVSYNKRGLRASLCH